MEKDVKLALVRSFLTVSLGIVVLFVYSFQISMHPDLSGLKLWHFAGLIPIGIESFFVGKKVSSLKKRKVQTILNAGVVDLALLTTYSYFVYWNIGLCSSHDFFVQFYCWIGAVLVSVLLTYLIPQKFFDKLESKDKPEDA